MPGVLGGETKNIDLLFYIVPLHRYLVVEVKAWKYEPADLGQLSGYMAMAKQALNMSGDNHEPRVALSAQSAARRCRCAHGCADRYGAANVR